MTLQSPSPKHILRSHSSPISCLYFSNDNERIYSGDTSGLVVVTSSRSLRSLASWNAHTDGLLGVQEWGTLIITHGRDNKLHVWSRVDDTSSFINVGGSASVPGLPVPALCYSMDINALNYCRFSLLPRSAQQVGDSGSESNEPQQALIAVPNLIESSWADIWSLPSCERMHAAIGKPTSISTPSIFTPAYQRRGKTGIIMSLHLFSVPAELSTPETRNIKDELRLFCAYEDGSVTLWRYATPGMQVSIEGIGWESIWAAKLHADSIMAMTVSRDNTFALTVSADHLIGRYDLTALPSSQTTLQSYTVVHRTKHPGNATVAIRGDGKVCAVGGWDGKIRLHSTRSLKHLGTLRHHKSSCQALTFACFEIHLGQNDTEEDEEEMTAQEKEEMGWWLVSGGKDSRVSVWVLMSFEKGERSA